jgi:triphosphoribosyl-dephospho-CoA synthase
MNTPRSLCFQLACIWEATARKVGNVHPTKCFADTEYMHFVTSALAIGWVSNDRGGIKTTGGYVYEAVRDTKRLVGTNTNLGIVLLLAPLFGPTQFKEFPLREAVTAKLARAGVQDAQLVYRAIRLANPGGLGDAPEQDVRSEPAVTLLEAMKLAADRDLIARQYANGYADVFDLGVPAFTDAFAKYGNVEAAVISCQLAWMAAFPDSLIARKRGLAVAEDVQRRVQHVLSLGGLDTPGGRRAGVALDAHLRSDGNKLNPGTTADLVAACLFVALRENKVTPSAPFRWNVPDWL